MVEFALVVPLLFLLIFGIIEFGFAFNDYQSVRQGVRDGARNAVVGTYGSSTSCGITGAATANTATQEIICSTKSAIGLSNSNTRVDVKIPATLKKGDSIVVCAQYQLQSFTGLFAPFLNNVRLRSRVETRIEKDLTTGGPNAAAETPPGSGDWAWC